MAYASSSEAYDKRGNLKKRNYASTVIASYHRHPSDSDYVLINSFENNIRRLTPIECERLQGFPDNWTKYGTKGLISDTQRYRMCGNAVTVDVVEEIFKRILCLKKS